ncbi:MAG: response regulator [Planctomycetes bacterium]|nr:response regulator [Planctomycetota bacterium]
MPTHSTPQQRLSVLVLAPPEDDHAKLLAALNTIGEVHTIANVDEALAALSLHQYDIVISPSTQLVPLAQATGQQYAELLLEKIGQGVCMVTREGELAWLNAKLRSYPATVIERVRQVCQELCQEFAAEKPRPDEQRGRRRTIAIGHDYYFDITATPLLDASNELELVAALIWDVTATRGLQEKLNAIDSAGRELVRLDSEATAEMDVEERLQLLEDKIIRYSRELMHFDHFAVRVLDRHTNRLETILASGLPEKAKSLDMNASADGHGISGYVAARGRSYICPDVTKDPRYLPGLDHARSSLTVPLRLHDQVVGILNVESETANAFSEDDRQTAEIFGNYIAIALHILKLLAVERRTTTGQIAADVTAELAAPLNDIVSEATALIEQCRAREDICVRLRAIIHNVDRAKRAMQTMTDTRGIKGLVPEQYERDPLLDGKRILIADDEDIIRETLADVLTKAGALTVMARDGDEAIAMIHAQHFDLVLSDIKMPYKNGYEVFATAKQTNIHCPVILITGFGYDPNHSIVRASKEGLAGVLFKPFKVEQLVEEVRHALTTTVI